MCVKTTTNPTKSEVFRTILIEFAQVSYMYTYILFLRKNILFYFEEKIMFIKDKNKIDDFERERNLSVL
jgi:hypothetical protein